MQKNLFTAAIFALACISGMTTAGETAETKPTDDCTFCDTWQP